MSDQKIITVGQRVRCALHYCGAGIVFAVHGEQKPETVKTCLDRVGVSGGNARFDIVFDNGSVSYALPESIVRGIQWKISDEVATDEEIAAALANAEAVKAQKTAAEIVRKDAFAAEIVRLGSAPEYATLKQGDDMHSGKLAAANIRIELKKKFPGVKFSVRVPDYGSVRIQWTDGPTVPDVEEVTKKYKSSHFNSMEDIRESTISPFHTMFGGLDYVSEIRDTTPGLIEKAIDRVFEKYAYILKDAPRPSVDDYEQGRLYRQPIPGPQENMQRAIRTALNEIRG